MKIQLLLTLALSSLGALPENGEDDHLSFSDTYGEDAMSVSHHLKEVLDIDVFWLDELAVIKHRLMDELLSGIQTMDSKIEEIEDEGTEDLLERSQGKSIFEINSRKNIGKFLFQSDIVLTRRQLEEMMKDFEATDSRTKRLAYKDDYYPNTIWGEEVFYRFHKNADDLVQNAFMKAAKQWEDVTCIDFIEDNNEEDAIVVVRGDGCWSYVGRIGGEQGLSLGEGCEDVGAAAHEIGHALGLFHTMSRYDRDQFIAINMKNVHPQYVDQFTKESESTSTVYGMPYDYSSIMHYGARSASHNNKPTMIAIDTNYQKSMGSSMISFIDISMVNDHYKCKERCQNNDSAQCKNGGFPHPRNCSTCICPSGYGGDLCDRRPPGCGRTLHANATKQLLVDKNGFGSDIREDFSFCNYWIEAPEGSRIEVTIRSFSHGYDIDGCVFGGVEIKSNKDQTQSGYRFCAERDRNTTLLSASNRLPIITFNRVGIQETILEYKIAAP